jgi:hypothetical protein
MDLATNPRSIEIDLDVFGPNDLLWPATIETDSRQPITRKQPCPRTCAMRRHEVSDYALAGVDPSDTVPGRSLAASTLDEVKDAGRDEQSRAD